MSESEMELSAKLLAVIVCPACHAKFAVDYDRHEVVCTGVGCGLAFPVKNQIPALLLDQARST